MKKEVRRRREQAERDYINRLWRGIDKYAPSGASSEYTIGVYPLVNRRGRDMGPSFRTAPWEINDETAP